MHSPNAQSSPGLVHSPTSQPSPHVGEQSVRKRRKITRDRNGCLTCRKRRKRCDYDRPSCEACIRLKLDCQWDFASSSQSAIGTIAARRSRSDDPSTSNVSLGQDETTGTPSWLNASMVEAIDRSATEDIEPEIPSASIISQRSQTPRSPLTTRHGAANQTALLQESASRTRPEDTTSSIFGGMSTILEGISFDDATLHSWAAECLSLPTTQTVDPFQSLSEVLLEGPEITPDCVVSPVSISVPQREVRPTTPLASSRHRAQLLKHYQASLSSLLSCAEDSTSTTSAFAAFTKLAEASSSSEAGQGLQLSIVAWAGRHMANQGQLQYEAVSEKLGEKAARIMLANLDEWRVGSRHDVGEAERMTLLAGALMVMQFKICRGDVWGYEIYLEHLLPLSASLYQVDSRGIAPDSLTFSFFGNLVYHDLLSSRAYSKGPLVPYHILLAFSTSSPDFLHTLTGVCFPLFCRLHQIVTLSARRRRRIRGRTAQSLWTDEELFDLVQEADDVEKQLAVEKTQMEMVIRGKPALSSHRFLHEAYRIACLMAIHAFILCEPPTTYRIQLLVRQSLSLLEEMQEKALPGFCSAHWLLFVTGLSCCGLPRQDQQTSSETNPLPDRQRIERLYDIMCDKFAFGNVSRSRQVIQQVWSRNQGGSLFIDWVDMVEEIDWELFVV